MKRVFFFFLFIVSFSVSGQKVSFSQEITKSQDKDVIEIREQWKSYIQDCFTSFIKKDKSLISKYWNDEELENGFSNLEMYQVSPTVPLCLFGETVTYDITKMENGFYRIKSMMLMSDSTSKSVPAIFNIYANQENSKFKFYSYFYLAKSTLKHYTTKNIEYFYPSDYDFDKKKAKEAEDFYSLLINKYSDQPKNKIKYIVAENLDEANSYIGFDYSIRSGTSKDAGYFLQEQNTILSTQIFHSHEFVHSVFDSKYPNAPLLFLEGIATYFGGTCGEEFAFHVAQLLEMINTNPNADLSNFDKWNVLIENKTNPFYTIGAAFIDYAYKKGGTQKVLALFQYPYSSEGIFSAISKELGIEKNSIDSFLKGYLKNLYKEQKTKVNKG